MQEYLQKTHLSSIMDEIGMAFALLAGSMALFLLLWGVRLTSLIAGSAAFTLCMLLRARNREHRLRQREDRLRRRIGGEMKLEAWTVCPPRQAHFEAALLLDSLRPMEMEKLTGKGVLCLLPDLQLRALVACAQLPAGEKLTARDAAAFQRECAALGADRGYLCGADAGQGARDQGRLSPRIVFVERERMIALAGAASPAGDAQLVALGRRFAGNRSLRILRKTVLEQHRAPKYLLYGLLLNVLFILSRQATYAIAGCACLLLMAACRFTAGKQAPQSLE